MKGGVYFLEFLVVTGCLWEVKAQYDIPAPDPEPEPTPEPTTISHKVSIGDPVTDPHHHHHHHHHDHKPMPYSFKYGVNDPSSGNVHSRSEVGDDAGVVRGSYQLIQPDGSLRIVDYTADWVNGFKANVRIIPNYAPQPPTSGPNNVLITTPGPLRSTPKNPLSAPFKVGPHTVVCLTCN